MLSKPIYEVLPYTYLAIGGIGALLAEPFYAIYAAIVVYIYGAHIYNKRSINRRTDPKRKRKRGILPEFIYGQLPFLYILTAALMHRFYPKDSSTLFAICFVTLGLYLVLRRASFRHHKTPVSS